MPRHGQEEKVRMYSIECTELENHLSDWYRDNLPNEDWGLQPENEHCLTAFVDGYSDPDNREAYTGGEPENEKLMDEFLRIAKADIDGQWEYNIPEYEIVLKALTTFGL